MRVNFSVPGGHSFTADTTQSVDASIDVSPYVARHLQPQTFGLPEAHAAPFSAGSFTASVDSGASCNCPIVDSLCVHSNGTHTECVGHVLGGRVTLSTIFSRGLSPPGGLFSALLLTVRPEALGTSGDEYAPGAPTDSVISFGALRRALDSVAASRDTRSCAAAMACVSEGGAVCLRTYPNTPLKRAARWTGANAPYCTPAAIALIRSLGAQHLAVDLPSLDKEEDGGAMLSHRAWWDLGARAGADVDEGLAGGDASGVWSGTARASTLETPSHLCDRLLTELAYFDDALTDGPYLLNLQVSNIDLDAAPARVVLTPLRLSS